MTVKPEVGRDALRRPGISQHVVSSFHRSGIELSHSMLVDCYCTSEPERCFHGRACKLLLAFVMISLPVLHDAAADASIRHITCFGSCVPCVTSSFLRAWWTLALFILFPSDTLSWFLRCRRCLLLHVRRFVCNACCETCRWIRWPDRFRLKDFAGLQVCPFQRTFTRLLHACRARRRF